MTSSRAVTSRPEGLAEARVAVVGLGLMGGSLGLALRGAWAERLGHDPDEGAVRGALACGAVDRADVDPRRIVPLADVVMLAAPVREILDLVESLPNLHPGAPAVLDLGSTKGEVSVAFERLPERFDAIGGHPMCGRETAGIEHAEPGLFRGAAFAITPNARTGERSRRIAGEIVAALGASPLWVEPDLHDRWTAATSHVQDFVLSYFWRSF